jgi:hypothetical protein
MAAVCSVNRTGRRGSADLPHAGIVGLVPAGFGAGGRGQATSIFIFFLIFSTRKAVILFLEYYY